MKITVNNSVKTKLDVGDIVKLSTDVQVKNGYLLAKDYYMVVEVFINYTYYYTLVNLTDHTVVLHNIQVDSTEEVLAILENFGDTEVTIYSGEKCEMFLRN